MHQLTDRSANFASHGHTRNELSPITTQNYCYAIKARSRTSVIGSDTEATEE